MDKTRMGKRVASLLLSLVMMLSLLPTAAYATMADGVDTQGAIVSENGTDVSDDSNSSGNTDDLQVGGSEGNGDTGAQQVGDSSGSGTAGDTTGAEGGADPTDSANENDSADPQDDGDAVMPVASSVVSTSEELVAAIAAANDGDTITLGEGEFTTYGNTSPKKSLTFVGAGTGTVWTIGNLSKDVKGEGNGDCSFDGCETITFQNMTLKSDGADYRGFIRISNTAVKKCTLVGKTAYWGYETAKFEDSTFNAPVGDYALWDYSTKAMTLEGCTFNISGKGVNVYVEQPSTDARTVEVNSCTVNSDKAGKAFLNIKNSTQAFDVTLSGTNTVTGLKADGTTGSALYQVETTEVTETTGNPVTVKQENTAGVLETVYEVKQPSANVAKVGDTEYATLDKAIAALSGSSYTLELLDESAWDVATPVYWAAGSQSGYAATLADALTAAYKANGDITIVCRPGTDVGKLTHGHVADNITIYGNNAYISSGECDLEVDTYMFSRDTGKQVTTGGAYLDKDITVTAYELDNLGVWGQRHTDHKVTVNLTDCDSVNGITVQRVYISGTTGVNDITLTGCDFATKATSVYSNADGKVVIDNCSFTGAQVPVNFNHKANGTQTVTVQNSAFTNCGDNGDWKQFAAPVRFVNSGSGTMNTTVGTCTFTDTVGGNGDILLGDGRVGEKSNDVKLTVENTAANVQAQQPGYYAKDGTTDESKQGTKNVAASDTLTTSVTQLMPSSETTSVAEVKGVKYKSLQAAIDAATEKATVILLADTRENVTIAKKLTLDLNGHTLNGGQVKAKPALTVSNSSVTIQDSSAAQTGTIMREDTAANSGVSSHYVIDIQGKYGFLKFEGGNVKNNSGTTSGKGASLIRLGNDSVSGWPTLTIKGGTFTQDNFIAIKVDRGTLHLLGGTVNSANSFAIENWNNAYIKGGTVNGTVSTWVYSTGAAFSKLEISGGTVNGNVASVNYDNAADKQAQVYVTGGTVTGTLGTYTYNNGLVAMDETAKATIEVTGGTFSKDPTQYVVENSAITENDDGTFGVAKAYLAKIGDTEYYTMDEAFHAVKAGETIVMLRDYTTNKVQNSGDESFTIDLGGHTWTANIVDTASAAFEINYSDVTLTVKNGKVVSSQLAGLIPSAMSGTITYNNSKLVFDGVEMTANGHSGIETNGSNTNDTVTLKNSTLNVPNGYGIYFPSSGTLTIDNSKINAKTMGVQVCAGSLNVTGDKTAITVTGDGVAKTENDGAIEDGAAISIVERTGYKGLSEIKVSGGTFTAKGSNDAVKAYKWENQTASDFTQAAKVAVSGGTFSSAVDKSLCAGGFIPTQNSDGTYGVKEGKYVAKVGSTEYETLTEAIGAAQDGQTVTLLADATEDVVISKSITLNLGGKTLTNTNVGKATISVQSGTVTVKNGNVVGGNDYYNIEAKKDANLTLTDVTATAGNTGSSMIDNWGTLTITSGTYTGGLNVVKSEEGSKLTITGGTFTGNYATNGYTGVILVYGDTTISGGEFIQSLTTTGRWNHPQVIATGVVEGYTAITRVTGGHFVNKMSGEGIFRGIGKATSDNFEVSGGTFNKAISDAFCANGFIPTKNADGTYGVKEGQYVAEIGSKKYETLADAIRLATKGKTITLLADVEQNTQLTIDKSITLDLNGKTIKNTVDIWGDNTNAILSIKKGAKVTITGNGTIDAKENDCYAINMVKGDLTIENGTFYGNVSVVQVQEGTLSVKGGTFDLHQKWEGSSKYLINCIDDAYVGGSANVAISGGTFVGFDPNVSPEQKVDGKAPSFAAPGTGITRNADGSFTAVDGMTAQILDKDGNSVKAYRTLAEAVAAAQDGQTVRLMADVEQNAQLAIDKSITLDLNGKTIKISGYTAEKAQVSVKGNLTIQDSSEAQTGKICSDYTGTAGRVVSVENGGKLTIAGGTITTEGMSGLSGSAVYIASGAEVNMTGGAVKVDAKRGNVAMNVKGSTGVFTMSGGSVIAEAGDGTETYITAISGSSGSTIQISAGTVSGPQAVFARSSATTITGGNFTGSITVKNGSISGGTFDRALDKKACAAGYVPTQNGDGTYGVEIGKFTVKVTSRTTGSDSPVANVAGGGSDITYAEGITVTASAISGYNFVGWFVNEYTGTPYSTNLTCEVKPTDDWTMIAVYEPISGGKFWLTVTASEFTVNGGAVQDSYLYEQFAVGASVTVNFTGSENFLYWVNASNKVVSTEKSYTFIMGSETTLKAVYGKARQNQATVVFISHSDQIISSKAYTTSDTIQFPVPPIKMGCTFTGWSMTEAEIRAAMANNSGIIQVRAHYTEPSIACTVTVVYPEGTDNQVVNAVVGKAIDVTAKDIEGKTFSYWTDDKGTVLGYTKTLKLAPSGDMTVKAVYDEAAKAKPVITISEVSATTANESYVVTFMATRAVPDGYKVVKQGILWSRDAVCGEDGAAAYMQFDSNGKLPTGVNAYIGNSLELNGVTRLDITTKYNDRTFYGRGYMVLESDAGELLYIYTNTIASGSYDSLTE